MMEGVNQSNMLMKLGRIGLLLVAALGLILGWADVPSEGVPE